MLQHCARARSRAARALVQQGPVSAHRALSCPRAALIGCAVDNPPQAKPAATAVMRQRAVCGELDGGNCRVLSL